MKKILTFLIAIILALPGLTAQSYFLDDFENATVNDYLGNSDLSWTTWSNSPGSSEDGWVTDKESYSGKQSVFIESANGGGPVDLVLPFGGVHTSGRFKFTSKWLIPSNTGGAYFNFQGDASTGSTWALDVYFYDDGNVEAGRYIYTSYPQDQWFELVFDIDLTNNRWEMFIDGNSVGSWSNPVNRISYLDVYSLFYNTGHWIDDIGFCINNACAADLSLDKVTIDPNPVCTNHPADVTISLTNNGPETASDFLLGIDIDGQARVTKRVQLNDLAMGKDTTITIPGMVKPSNPGTGIAFKAIHVEGDKDASNNEASGTLDVLPSPNGFDISQGSTFQGRYRIGDVTTPDLVESGKTNSYELLPGPGFSNSNYSSAWTISSVVARTRSGAILPSSAYSISYPTGSSNGVLSFKGSDTYMDSLITFTITVKNGSTGCDSSVVRSIQLVPTPKLGLDLPATACIGEDVEFENKSTIHSGNNTFMWYFGDNDSSDADNPFHAYKAAGTYSVRMVATSHPWNIVKDTTVTIKVNEIPVVKFKVNNKCQGTPIDFQNQSTVAGGGTMTYDWDFGDASTHSTSKDPSHLYAVAKGYRVTLKVNSNGCVSSLSKNANLFARPVASFTAPSAPTCAHTEVQMGNTSTITYGNQGSFWSFGDGSSSTSSNGNHTYKTAGTYQVKLIAVSEFECKDSIVKPVVIKPAPEPAFTADQFCGKKPTTFNNTTVEALANPVYTWTFSDGFNSNLKNVTRSWPYEGPFTATLKADYTNGCSGTTTQDFTVYIQPKANFTLNDVCSGEQVAFVNKSEGDRSGIQYNWDFGDNSSSTLMAPVNTYSPAKTTTYTVTLVVSYPQACSDTMRKNITVSEAPVCDFSYKPLGFMNTQFTPSNTSYAKYEWFFGEGGTSVLTNPKYQYTYDGNFNVTMRATNAAGCSCEITKRVSANTGVNSVNAASNISIYPNPNNGTFTVKHASGQSIKVEVFSVIGSKVYSSTSESGSMVVGLGDEAKGIYLVKVTSNGVTTTTKITVN